MGVSTDAVLIWGFNVDRDDDCDACELLDTFCDERYSDLDKAEETHGGRLAHHCADTHILSKASMSLARRRRNRLRSRILYHCDHRLSGRTLMVRA